MITHKPTKAYTVCFLFSPDMDEVLLQKKNRTDFAGLYNGVGGKLEPGEKPEQCAIREIKEETGIDKILSLTWLGTLSLPHNCDTHENSMNPEDPSCILYFYAGIIPDKSDINPPAGAEELMLVPLHAVFENNDRQDGTEPVIPIAGDGDVEYFIRRGINQLLAASDRR